MPEDLNYTQLYEYNILLDDIIEKLSTIQNANKKASNIKFFTQEDVARVTGMSKSTVKKLFNDPEFPACDYGKTYIVEANALLKYFDVRRSKKDSRYWRKYLKH